jgi:hypothetical protein
MCRATCDGKLRRHPRWAHTRQPQPPARAHGQHHAQEARKQRATCVCTCRSDCVHLPQHFGRPVPSCVLGLSSSVSVSVPVSSSPCSSLSASLVASSPRSPTTARPAVLATALNLSHIVDDALSPADHKILSTGETQRQGWVPCSQSSLLKTINNNPKVSMSRRFSDRGGVERNHRAGDAGVG